jgi:hypothetical protein
MEKTDNYFPHYKEGKKEKIKKEMEKTDNYFPHYKRKFYFYKKCFVHVVEKTDNYFPHYKREKTAKQKMFVSNALKKTDGCFYHVWR